MQNSSSEKSLSVFSTIFNSTDEPQSNLKSFATALPSIVWITDEYGKVEFCNDYGLKYLGFENSELIDEDWTSTIHPDEIKSITEIWRTALLQKKSFQNIQKQKNRDGDYEWFKVIANPLFDKNGKLSHWIGISINIDNEIRESKELQATNLRLDLSIKNTKSGIWDWNLEKDTIVYNNNWWEMLGFKKGELEESTSIWEKLLHEDDKDQALNKLNNHINGENDFYESVYRLRTKKNTWLWIYDSGRVIDKDPAGNALRFVGIQQDYSTRKYQQDIITSSEKKMRILAESAQKLLDFKSLDEIRTHCVDMIYTHVEKRGLITFTAYEDNYTKWRVLKAKGYSKLVEKITKLIGKSIENLSGSNVQSVNIGVNQGKLGLLKPNLPQLLTGVIPPKIIAGIMKILNLDKIYGIEIVKNEAIHGVITIIPKDQDLELDHNFIETIVLQTASALERKEHEKKILQQNDELSNLNKDMDMVIKALSHDLKAPINTAKGIIQLGSDMNDLNPNTDLIFNLKKSLGQLDDITDDLLGMVINNRTSIDNSNVNIKALVKEAIEEQTNQEAFDEIDWLINLDSKYKFNSDSKRIKLILRNLISNAIKYRDKNKVRNTIKIMGTCDKKGMRMCVKDNGIGMKNEQLEKVFDIFYRADKSQRGIGLGLHIIKQTVQKLDGTIEINSIFEEGTEIIFTIPNLEK